MMKRNRNKVFLGMGSNLGNREEKLFQAYDLLKEFFNDISMASIYESLPMYMIKQPKFLNTVFSGYTQLLPLKLLKKINIIEKLMGRKREKNAEMGPRYIDLDILLFNDIILHTDNLIIPHSRLKERVFVLKPLIELEPDIKDPHNGNLYSMILTQLPDQGVSYYKSWDQISINSDQGNQ